MKEANNMIPDSRKEICLLQASWSIVGSTCFARRDRIRFTGSVFEDVKLGSVEGEAARRAVARVVERTRYMQYNEKA